MTIQELIEQHKISSHELSEKRNDEILLWYADLGVQMRDNLVVYHCPRCGRQVTTSIESFISQGSNDQLLCDTCRGDLEERGGALD